MRDGNQDSYTVEVRLSNGEVEFFPHDSIEVCENDIVVILNLTGRRLVGNVLNVFQDFSSVANSGSGTDPSTLEFAPATSIVLVTANRDCLLKLVYTDRSVYGSLVDATDGTIAVEDGGPPPDYQC